MYKHNGFIALYGDFYMDGELFLPISINHEVTCSELFGNYGQIKYKKYFEQDFFNDTLKNYDEMEIIENSLVLGSSGNYWHDLIDFYSKIFAYDNKIDNNIDKIIVGNSLIKDPLVTLLKKINIQKRILSIDSKVKIFRKSYFISNKNLIKTNDFYRSLFLDTNVKQNKNIYISRKDSNTRFINNEDEVINFLDKFNFEVYELANLSFLQQVKLFSEAKIIISMHGAALTNLMFCNPETIVVEIAADFYEQYKLTGLDVDMNKYIYLKENKTDWFSDMNSVKFHKYTRSMYNHLSQMNGLKHYFYFVKNLNLKSNTKLKVNFAFQEITFTNLKIDMLIFKNFFSKIFE